MLVHRKESSRSGVREQVSSGVRWLGLSDGEANEPG